MMIDHIGIAVSNAEKSKAFYAKALAPLGVVCIGEDAGWVGFGRADDASEKAEFWFGEDAAGAHAPMHIAFIADTRAAVDAFYRAAIAAGATCNGKPAIRAMYHPHYYGAFVIDRDGHNIEAVCHREIA